MKSDDVVRDIVILLEDKEARACLKTYRLGKTDLLLPERIGWEQAYEARDALIRLCDELVNVVAPRVEMLGESDRYHSVTVSLNFSQIRALEAFCTKCLPEDIVEMGFSQTRGRLLTGALWQIRVALTAAVFDIDRPIDYMKDGRS